MSDYAVTLGDRFVGENVSQGGEIQKNKRPVSIAMDSGSELEKRGQNLKASFDLPKNWYSGVSDVADYKYVSKMCKNKMADQIWRKYVKKMADNVKSWKLGGFDGADFKNRRQNCVNKKRRRQFGGDC